MKTLFLILNTCYEYTRISMSLATVICECSLNQFSTSLYVSLFVHWEPQQIFMGLNTEYGANLVKATVNVPITLLHIYWVCQYKLFLISEGYTCQLSRLRCESHVCGLKTSISRRLTLAGQFLTPDWKMWVVAVLLDTISKNMLTQTHCKERKPCLKWILNDKYQFLTISSFPDNFAFGRLWTSSEAFGHLRKTSDFFGRLRTSSGIFGNDRVIFKNPSTPRIKISRLYVRKSWQVYLMCVIVSTFLIFMFVDQLFLMDVF